MKWKVAPLPGCDSTQIRPPWRSTIVLQMARPMPVPGYSVRRCSRWKISKIRSLYFASMPMPLSRDGEQPLAVLAAGVDVDFRRRRAAELHRVANQFWKSWAKLRARRPERSAVRRA